MARRGGRLGDYLAVDDYTGFTCFASELRLDYNGAYAKKPLNRNLQEIASPINDPVPLPFYRPSNYEVTPNCVGATAPTYIGTTTVPTRNNNIAAQVLVLDPSIPDMEIGCSFIIR